MRPSIGRAPSTSNSSALTCEPGSSRAGASPSRSVTSPGRCVATGAEAGELVAQEEELLLVPPARHPERAPPRPRCAYGSGSTSSGPRDAEDGGRPADPEREREHGEQRVARARAQAARGVAGVGDPGLQHGPSGPIGVRARLESGPAAPPAPSQQCGRRAKRLPPEPPPRRRAPVARGVRRVLRRARPPAPRRARRAAAARAAARARAVGGSGARGRAWRLVIGEMLGAR